MIAFAIKKVTAIIRSNRHKVAWLLVLLPSLLVLAQAPEYLAGGFPTGDDSSSHIVSIAELTRRLAAAEFHLWNPNFNQGFALAHFYQPLPYFVSAFTALLAGGPEQAGLAYKLWVVVLLTLMPWAFFLACRRLFFGRFAAIAAAMMFFALATKSRYGLSFGAFFGLGLYSSIFATVFLPLALAESIRYVSGRGRLVTACLLVVGLYFSHSFLGVALVPFVFVGGLTFSGWRQWRAVSFQLLKLGGSVGILTAFWTVPMLLTMPYMGGWPWGSSDHMHGLGLVKAFKTLLAGDLTDHKRLPWILAFFCIGWFCGFLRQQRSRQQRFLLWALLVALVFLSGRASFGPLVNMLYPPNLTIPLERYLMFAEFFAVLVAASGMGSLLLYLRINRRVSTGMSYVLLAQLGLPFLLFSYEHIDHGLQTRPDSQRVRELEQLSQVLAQDSATGRYFTHGKLGLKSHWDMYLPALLSGKPGGVSYGAGYHDGPGFFFWDKIRVIDRSTTKELLELYNIRYLITDSAHQPERLPARRLFQSRGLNLFKIHGNYGYFSLVPTPRIVATDSPRYAREVLSSWLTADFRAQKTYLRLREPIGLRLPFADPSPTVGRLSPRSLAISGAEKLAPITTSKVYFEEAHRWHYSARIKVGDDQPWLVFKMAAHPFWRAEVDGKVAPIYYVAPAMMGLPLTPGEHIVQFSYQQPVWQGLLLLIGLLFAVFLILPTRISQS